MGWAKVYQRTQGDGLPEIAEKMGKSEQLENLPVNRAQVFAVFLEAFLQRSGLDNAGGS